MEVIYKYYTIKTEQNKTNPKQTYRGDGGQRECEIGKEGQLYEDEEKPVLVVSTM